MRAPLIVMIATALGACSTETSTGLGGPTLSVNVAPLDLPGLDLACYDLRVDNGAALEETVIARGDPGLRLDQGDSDTLCSTRFGNGAGGDISYVAPCDSQQSAHTVTLWLDGLYTGTEAAPVLLPDYQDPCPAGCALQAACQENADTPVSFNITVMRRAQQGFFDIGVNFDNVFCSAKADCREDTDGDGVITPADDGLALLHNGDGERDTTLVLGFACTGGSGADTHLYRDPIVITCGSEVFTIDPGQAPGNMGPVVSAPSGVPLVFETATYWGAESLPDVNKVFWNVAIGVDEAVLASLPDCVLTAHATVSNGPEALPGGETPDGTVYPRVRWTVPLSDAGALACLSHGLDDGPEVSTDYAPHAYTIFLAGGFGAGVEPYVDGFAPKPRFIAGSNAGRLVLWSDGTLTSTSSTFPGEATLAESLLAVSVGGSHGTVIRADGSIGFFGTALQNNPSPPSGNDFVQISAGGYQAGARRADGSVVAWGRSSNGQLNIPAGVFTDLSSYSYGFCGIVAELDGQRTLRCWGHNDTNIRTEMPAGGDYAEVVTGWNHGCARRDGGLVVCWGNDTVQNATPADTAFKELARGLSTDHACGLTVDDTILCWGSNAQGQADAASGTFTKVFVGQWFSCGIRPDDSMVCWGYGPYTSLPDPP